MGKLVNYSAIKMQGYMIYSLTCGLKEKERNQIIENYLARFNSDDECMVFLNTVLYPYDSLLYSKLMTLSKTNSYESIVQELGVDEKIIREKVKEYFYNDLQGFLVELGIKNDFSMLRDAKK